MNARTTIILEKPILDRIRETARKNRQTLRETIRDLIVKGLTRVSQKKIPPLDLPKFPGRPKVDISNRVRLYEMWEQEK